MDKFQRDTPVNSALPATLFRKGNGYGVYLIWIFAISVSFSAGCDNDTNDNNCLQKTISVQEGETVEIPLNPSEMIQDVCIWSNSTSRWENACHFSNGVCRTLLIDFKEDISIKGNKFELKNVSSQASRIYKLLDKPGNCMMSMRVSVLSAKPTISSSRSGAFNIHLEKWSGVTWVYSLASIPILAILDYL
ncbi:uncharacterized protein LOC112542476 isoform X2 [Python bivittatus]|uniref:Uncharacterized protein LOC112542476 isoform X2 n=1 Tax=Python bivittatus TaxID=176946 RepID=A0A9F5J787_PYTBI|nr:uncharacterized protein LOC112542476 isoform X2 [Python bivittatus]